MSSSNPRTKARKNGTMSEYNGQHVMGAGVPGVPPPPPQMIPNGTTGQQQQNNLDFVIASVQPTHPMHVAPTVAFRNPPRNLPNPTMQFAQGEVQINSDPNNVTTITRYNQGAPAQSFQPASQIGPYTSAPPTGNLYSQSGVFNAANSVYNPQNSVFQAYPSAQYFSQVLPQTVFSQMYQTQPSTEYFQPRLYQAPNVMIPAAQAAPPAVQPAKEKKILKIVNPDTNEVTNEEQISASMSSAVQDEQQSAMNAVEPPQGGRRSATAFDVIREQSNTVPSNASQKFSLQVAQSVLADTSLAPSSSTTTTAPVTVPALSTPSVPTVVPAGIGIPPTREMPPAPSVTPPVAVPTPVATVAREVSPATIEQTTIEEKPPEPEAPSLGAEKHVITEEILEETPMVVVDDVRPILMGAEVPPIMEEPAAEEAPMPSAPAAVVEELGEPPCATISEAPAEPSATGRNVDMVVEDAEKEETTAVEEVEEPEEVKLRRRQIELEQRRAELLQNPESVRLEERIYGREYLFLMRDFVLELKKHACPVKEIDLKTLGIDITSAPDVRSVDKRRFDNTGGSGTKPFEPNWMQKPSSKTKPYPGRASTEHRPHNAGGRTNKRPVIQRVSITNRENRGPVHLHQAADPWKPDTGKAEDANKKLYKEIRGLLNKITPSTFESLCEDFLRYQVYKNKEQMSEVINIIFDKAVEEPKFCPLYSDLCKRQVVEEHNACQRSEFRSGILSRCQQTFETKRQEEINKKRAEAEEEKEETRQKELKLEIMEMEAKERRRMFGNIGFIGQLFRHELIVPRILNWCLVHLLKSHSEEKGDEESIECAVRMLETVGKIADRQSQQQQQSASASGSELNIDMFFNHLQEQTKNVSNRVRFLIMNLLELRKNKWNPRKSADTGPKTIQEVHNDVKREEMLNKAQRDQYNKRYEGRASSDRRNPRPTVIGRQSQDGRGKPDPMRDQKVRAAAAAANMVVSSTSRKNQSLNSIDQPTMLGSTRPIFSSGSRGGGQSDRSSLPRNVSGPLRGAGRGSLASRDNSQPSSREPSESRKHSMDLERSSALAMASAMTHSASSGGLRRLAAGYAAQTAGGSSNALSASGDERGSNPRVEGDAHPKTNPAVVDEEEKTVDEEALCRRLKNSFSEYFKGDATRDELHKTLMEECASCSVRIVFRLIMEVGVEGISGSTQKQDRRRMAEEICLYMQTSKEAKEEALHGIADFCESAVERVAWLDSPMLWVLVAEMVCWLIMCDSADIEGDRPALGDFRNVFLSAAKDRQVKGCPQNSLLVCVLNKLVEIELQRDGRSSSTSMAFEEIKDIFSDAQRAEAEAIKLPSGETLYHLLLN